MSEREVFRVQGPDGRGPWRPGFSGLWSDPQPYSDFPPVQEDFGNDLLSLIGSHLAVMGGCAGCAVAQPEILCRWFSPSESERLGRLGFYPVRHIISHVYAESACQVVFWRRRPLTDHDGVIRWDALASKDAAE